MTLQQIKRGWKTCMWMHAPHCTANIYNVIHTLKYISLVSEEGAKKAVRKRNKAERERRTCDGAVCRNQKGQPDTVRPFPY
jgi:hypothetical protein